MSDINPFVRYHIVNIACQYVPLGLTGYMSTFGEESSNICLCSKPYTYMHTFSLSSSLSLSLILSLKNLASLELECIRQSDRPSPII